MNITLSPIGHKVGKIFLLSPLVKIPSVPAEQDIQTIPNKSPNFPYLSYRRAKPFFRHGLAYAPNFLHNLLFFKYQPSDERDDDGLFPETKSHRDCFDYELERGIPIAEQDDLLMDDDE